MKLLVTGGAGFVGSHLAERLAMENEVTILDNLSNGSLSNLRAVHKKVRFIKSDISDEKVNSRVGKVEGIFHLSCHPRSFSFSRPQKDVDGNLRTTVNMLELARRCDAKLVFTSNSGIYGEPQYLPMDEKHPIDCKTPYDVNKYASELQIRAFAKQYGLRTTVCRLATVYGSRQRVNEKLGWRPAVATFLECIMSGRKPVVFGDGQQTRDLIYVKDVVEGLIKAFNSKETNGDVFNLSTGIETSINSLLEQIETTVGSKLEPDHGPPSVGDIRRMCYSNEKARRTFGFEVKYPLDVALREYVESYRISRGR